MIHGAEGERDGVAAEYRYPGALPGRRGVDWHLRSQSLPGRRGRHQYDMRDVAIGKGSRRFYFDIAGYLGRF